MIYIWSGYHSPDLQIQLRSSWENNDLFILCPPTLSDYSFVSLLPPGEISILGEFNPDHLNNLKLQIELREINKLKKKLIFWTNAPDVPVLGVFTSGTISGKPRLVFYSKKNVEKALAGILSFFDPSQMTDIFCYPQPFHTFGLTLGYVHSFLYNRRLLTPEGKYSRAAHEMRVAAAPRSLLTLGAPAHFYDLAEYIRTEAITLGPSYSCIVGGAKVSVNLWNKIQKELNILSPSIGYGATEACPGITHQPPGLQPLEEGEIGFPIPGVEIENHPGLGILFRGENTCLAIIEGGIVTFPIEVLIRDNIKTRETDGVMIYQGRNELLLNRGGTKISLENLEETLQAVLKTRVVCFAIADERLGEDLGLLTQFSSTFTRENHVQAKPLVTQLLAEKFGHNFALKKWTWVDEIPLTENGKIDRKNVPR